MAADQIATKGLQGELLNVDPANGAIAVTKSDTLDIWGATVSVNSKCSRGLYVGTTGDVNVTLADGTKVTFTNVPVGFCPLRVRQIWTTSTTASGFIALY